MTAIESDLRAGLATLKLEISEHQITQLLSYLNMIAKWTKVYNLTAVRDPAEMLTHHLLDSLAAITPLMQHLRKTGQEKSSRLLDVGSGAGLPGIVIAICCPTIAVSCVDAVAKKTAFMRQAALELRLPNLTGLHARVETITQAFDVICSRAFASLPDFTNWSEKALAPGGVWLAMKGKHPNEELVGLAPNIEVFHVEQLQVPGLAAERCIIWMQQKKPI